MIHKLLKYLENQSLDYAVISGYKALFNGELNTGDVDILFKKQDFKRIESILKAFCNTEGFIIVQIYHQEVYAKNVFIFDPKTTELLNLDIYGKLHRKQTEFFTETEIFNNRMLYKNISILATHQEFLCYLIKKIDKNELSNTTFTYLQSLYFKDENLCENVLKKYFSNLSNLILEAFNSGDKNILTTQIEALKKDIIIVTKFSLTDAIKNKIRVVKRIIKPTGITISFLGPDGSGKSTIIDGLKNKSLPFRKTSYFHLKPINNKESSTNKATTNPHAFVPYSKLKSYFKLLFFIYQYNSGWLKNIWALKIKSTLVIFDRYYDDLIVDNKRYRYGGSKNAAKFARIFIRKPALYFILVADANIIYKRKQEVAFSELENQIKNYKKLANAKQYYCINVNKSPNDIVNEVYSILMKKMHERY